MRAEPLVGRAGQGVDAQLVQVQRPVRGGVHGVDVAAGAGLMDEADDGGDVGRGPHRVAGRGHRDPARAVAELTPRSRSAAARACRGRARRSARSRPRAGPRSPTGARWRRGPAGCRRPRRRAAGCGRRWPRTASSGRSCSDRRPRHAGRRRAGRRRRHEPARRARRWPARPRRPRPGWRCRPSAAKSAMASIAVSSICVPAGPSRRAQPSFNPGKRSRFIRSAPPHAGRSRPCASPRGPAQRPTGWRG